MMKKYLINQYLRLRYFLQNLEVPKILSAEETIDIIVSQKKSFTRFGDGEIRMFLSNTEEIGFQKKNVTLSNRLKEVLDTSNDKLLIGLPNTFGSISHFTLDSQIFWHGFNYVYAKKFLESVNLREIYGDATITRFYMAYRDKTDELIQSKVNRLKTIWDQRNLIIIEGTKTRLGVGNDLFNNANSIKRILCPPENAFDVYTEILREIKELVHDELILIALGPTATVLAYDLSRDGYWAIDVGHIDIEYSWYKQKALTKVLIKGKYVQENTQKHKIDAAKLDLAYQQSIIKVIEPNNTLD